MMDYYKNMEFCSSDCINDECFRNYTTYHQKQAEFLNMPVALSSSHKVGCNLYVEPDNG